MLGELEDRYVVFKRSDIKGTNIEKRVEAELENYKKLRKEKGKPPLEGGFLEEDWPEFRPAMTALLDRSEQEGLIRRLRTQLGVSAEVATDEELLAAHTSAGEIIKLGMGFEKLGCAMRGKLFDKEYASEDQNSKRPEGDVSQRKHSHYFKDVSKLDVIDVYGVCELFQVNDPSGATHHALKKLLLPGKRGSKSRKKDLQEAVDTLNRRIEMLGNDDD